MDELDEYGRLIDPGEPGLMAAPPSGPIVPPMPTTHVRSGRWPTFLKHFLADNPTCWGCGRKAVTGHHEVPFGDDESRELDAANILPVCVGCHWVVCHGADWHYYIPTARADLAAHKQRVSTALRIGED